MGLNIFVKLTNMCDGYFRTQLCIALIFRDPSDSRKVSVSADGANRLKAVPIFIFRLAAKATCRMGWLHSQFPS